MKLKKKGKIFKNFRNNFRGQFRSNMSKNLHYNRKLTALHYLKKKFILLCI
jgi:hypothetical protein